MSSAALSDLVSDQYGRWVYPQPILDLPAWLEDNWQWFDPSHAHRIFWPDREYRPGMDILVAGCGTNQAAVIALTNPQARVVALDVSQASLGHHRFLRQKYGLTNLDLHLIPIEDIGSLGRDFDLIISTGVLHHLASPELGLKALARCLRSDGVMALMLYAKYGRIGVDMLQSVCRDLGLGQDDASVQMVRDILGGLAEDHPVRSYMSIAPDLGYGAGLVDTFLHGRERNYSMGECRTFVATAGLVFQDLFFKAPYHPPPFSESRFHASVAALPLHAQWSIMERINFRNGCHFFMACHPQRPSHSYQLDLTGEHARDHVPVWRYRCGLHDSRIHRPDWAMDVTPFAQAVLRFVDGRRNLPEIAASVNSAPGVSMADPAEVEQAVLRLIQQLQLLDVLTVAKRPPSA